MFEFYKIVDDTETGDKVVRKIQLEEDAEGTELKKLLLRELDNYEEYTIEYIDRYYHCNVLENTFSIKLSEAVFEGESFVGCMVNNCFCVKEGESLPEYKDVRGATSVEKRRGIRRKY